MKMATGEGSQGSDWVLDMTLQEILDRAREQQGQLPRDPRLPRGPVSPRSRSLRSLQLASASGPDFDYDPEMPPPDWTIGVPLVEHGNTFGGLLDRPLLQASPWDAPEPPQVDYSMIQEFDPLCHSTPLQDPRATFVVPLQDRRTASNVSPREEFVPSGLPSWARRATQTTSGPRRSRSPPPPSRFGLAPGLPVLTPPLPPPSHTLRREGSPRTSTPGGRARWGPLRPLVLPEPPGPFQSSGRARWGPPSPLVIRPLRPSARSPMRPTVRRSIDIPDEVMAARCKQPRLTRSATAIGAVTRPCPPTRPRSSPRAQTYTSRPPSTSRAIGPDRFRFNLWGSRPDNIRAAMYPTPYGTLTPLIKPERSRENRLRTEIGNIMNETENQITEVILSTMGGR